MKRFVVLKRVPKDSKMTLTAPIHCMPDVESVDPGEAETIGELSQIFDKILETTARSLKDHGADHMSSSQTGGLNG